jgi:DMSO/TMAO reductase YedYZ molybdopterin-dependent catalytic subunit
MNSIGLPRRQFLGQSGALVASAGVLNSPLLTQAFASQSGEEIIPWSDQPSADPGVARGAIQNLQRWEDLDWLTPKGKFFNIAHYNRPHIDEQDWSLEITGLVRRPGRFRLSDIRARPRRELTFTLECSGNNGRPSFLTGIGTARWAGTSLAAMLREAELLDSGIEVVFVGADTGEEHVRDIKVPTSFARSMGVADAMGPDNLLCYEMYGAPLPAEHGFPLRLIEHRRWPVADSDDRPEPRREIRMATVVSRLASPGARRARHHRARHRRRRHRAAGADGPADCRQAHLLGKQRADHPTHPPVLTRFNYAEPSAVDKEKEDAVNISSLAFGVATAAMIASADDDKLLTTISGRRGFETRHGYAQGG